MLNLPALVRLHPLYVPYSGLQGAVFLINSRQADFRCAPNQSRARFGEGFSQRLRPAFLPSSLTHSFSNALVFSTSPPVSVCGTGTDATPYLSFPGSLKRSSPPPALRGRSPSHLPRYKSGLVLGLRNAELEASNFATDR